MTRVVIVKPAPPDRQHTFLRNRPATPREKRRIGEVAGGTAGKAAALCCCCPCAVMNMLVLAVYKVPAGLCRKAWKEKKRQRVKRRLLNSTAVGGKRGEPEDEGREVVEEASMEAEAAEVVELEKEMWDRFYGTGFWRSPSMKDT